MKTAEELYFKDLIGETGSVNSPTNFDLACIDKIKQFALDHYNAGGLDAAKINKASSWPDKPEMVAVASCNEEIIHHFTTNKELPR
jgi:hypothetical protein